MSDERFPYLKNFLKPTTGVGAKSAKKSTEEVSSLLAPGGSVRPGKKSSSGEGDTGGLLEEFNRGEVPLKATPNTAPQAPAPGERVLTCFECQMHENNPVNPRQGWGRCTFKGKGCYRLKPACSEVHRQDTDGPLDG